MLVAVIQQLAWACTTSSVMKGIIFWAHSGNGLGLRAKLCAPAPVVLKDASSTLDLCLLKVDLMQLIDLQTFASNNSSECREGFDL